MKAKKRDSPTSRRKRDYPTSRRKRDYPISRRKRYCFFCKNRIEYIDYKEIDLFKRNISDRGKIRPRRVTGVCVKHQSDLARAIKRARELALIGYTSK